MEGELVISKDINEVEIVEIRGVISNRWCIDLVLDRTCYQCLQNRLQYYDL